MHRRFVEPLACPVDPQVLPADAIRVAGESVVIQNILIEPRNIEFLQVVYHWAKEKKYYRKFF